MQQNYHDEHIKKAQELLAQMTVEEKTSQLSSLSPAIERLGIPAYHWWNEGLHGVARAGTATVFPQAIGLAATFDEETLAEVGRITAKEGRIKYNLARKQGDRSIYKGLTFWSPNINIYRDPRWGRGHETYGEDPVLTASLATSFVKAMQEGENPRYDRAAACLKHMAVHSGPEGNRHGFDSKVSKFDLYDTYLPAFEWGVKEADPAGVMGAYNMINGIPSCAHEELIEQVLRNKWGFKGYYVSDCGALADIHQFCLVTHTAVESAALALNAGCDLNCGNVYLHVLQAYKEGRVTMEQIDRSVLRLLAIRSRLGMLTDDCEYDNEADILSVESKEHLELAYDAAVKSAVLLKNNGVLPLKKGGVVGVIGPNAVSRRALEGNYNGTASVYSYLPEAVGRTAGESTRVLYAQGCHLYEEKIEGCAFPQDSFSEALYVAEASDVIIMCMGLDPSIEGEQGDANNADGAGDKLSLSLPGQQLNLLRAVKEAAAGKPIILVVLAGGALELCWADENCDAILYGWYPGAKGGDAIADLLYGVKNPSGKTPVTFYRSLSDLADFEDYSMDNRTYRYFKGSPLYPFGHGLSYTTFKASNAKVSSAGEDYSLCVNVENTGKLQGDAVVQVYASYSKEKYKTPICKLVGFKRISLEAGEVGTATVLLKKDAFLLTDEDGTRYMPESSVTLHIGFSQPDGAEEKITL